MSKDRYKLPIGVFLVAFRKNKVLLLRRSNTGYRDGYYSVPAGHIDGNESATQAILRETLEEIGAKLKPKQVKMVHTQHIGLKENNKEYLMLYFITHHELGEIQIKEKDKCDDLKWFPINKLPPKMIPYVRDAIKKIKQGITYSEFSW